MDSYRWAMHRGPDAGALRRMREHFRLPEAPMGEAWFMGDERRMFPKLMVDAPEQWPREELAQALEELTSGPTAFGHMEEWSEWFRFILPRAVEIGVSDTFLNPLETLISAVMVHLPDNTAWDNDYPQFRSDVLETLGRSLFIPAPPSECPLQTSNAPAVILHAAHGHEIMSGGFFSASLFLVAKYLPVELLRDWLESVVALEDPIWRASWVLWLQHAHTLVLSTGSQPHDLKTLEASWVWSHVVGKIAPEFELTSPEVPFLSAQRREHLIDAIRACTTQSRLDRWHQDLVELEARSQADVSVAIDLFKAAATQAKALYALRP